MASNAQQQKRLILFPIDNTDESYAAVKWGVTNVVNVETDVGILLHIKPHHEPSGSEDWIEDRFGSKLRELGLDYRITVLTFRTDADSVGSIICMNAKELGATCTAS